MMSKYNELVDHLVSTMPSNSFTMTYKERPPFVPKKVTTKNVNPLMNCMKNIAVNQ